MLDPLIHNQLNLHLRHVKTHSDWIGRALVLVVVECTILSGLIILDIWQRTGVLKVLAYFMRHLFHR